MTIAACYLSMEGVVFGADSTTTITVNSPAGRNGDHHFDYGQKIFEVGHESHLALVVWGIGSFDDTSYRTLTAELADDLAATPARTVEEVAQRFGARLWDAYTRSYQPLINRVRELDAKKPNLTDEERALLEGLTFDVAGGFCLGGWCPPTRKPAACSVTFDPLHGVAAPAALVPDRPRFWGAPNMVERLIYGMDQTLFDMVINSGKWTGSEQDLLDLVGRRMLHQPTNLPLREAVDWVFASVFATIKAFKFSHFDPICGGPVEIAVISTDRPFRWVRHKTFDAAI